MSDSKYEIRLTMENQPHPFRTDIYINGQLKYASCYREKLDTEYILVDLSSGDIVGIGTEITSSLLRTIRQFTLSESTSKAFVINRLFSSKWQLIVENKRFLLSSFDSVQQMPNSTIIFSFESKGIFRPQDLVISGMFREFESINILLLLGAVYPLYVNRYWAE